MRIYVIDKDINFCAWVKASMPNDLVAYSCDYRVSDAKNYDAILIDVMDEKAFNLLSILKSSGIHAAKLATMPFAEDGIVEKAMQSGADDFIRKPMSSIVLKTRLESAIARLHSSYYRNAILDALPDTTFIADKKGRLIYFRKNKVDMFRWSEPDIIGKTTIEYLGDTDLGRLFTKSINSVLSSGNNVSFHYSVEINNETRWRQATLIYYENSEPKVVGIVHDYTDLIQAYKKQGEQYNFLCSITPLAAELKKMASGVRAESDTLLALANKLRAKLALEE